MISLSKPLEHLHSRFYNKFLPVASSFVELTLAERHHFHSAVQVFKVLHHLCIGYLRNLFVYAEAYIRHSGQNKHHLLLILWLVKMDFSIMELWFGTVYFLSYLQLKSYVILNLYIKGCMLIFYYSIIISCFCCIMYVFCYCIVCLFFVLCLLCILLLYSYIFCSCLVYRALLKNHSWLIPLPFKFIKSLNIQSISTTARKGSGLQLSLWELCWNKFGNFDSTCYAGFIPE